MLLIGILNGKFETDDLVNNNVWYSVEGVMYVQTRLVL